eukprot:CAMPEP_0172661996 /NCGR_PEP_ID=MMETSP1074-20121228/5076_1 /TAXON_ID=2916 /ORGANISM="Ceratium fusus, Strain PA161109" /LENGTH=410 /DNA_ID=CAMNT_0013477851 /DNA_START=52 /DNA_END=1284 /DNA_ORIENTATION=+
MAGVKYRLQVLVDKADGLQHMNHFTGDHPYVACEVKHSDKEAGVTAAETKPVTEGDTLNPVWNEVLELQPWQPGEALELTVYDKGLMGSKTEGKVMLPSEVFFPHGFRGTVGIIGLQGATLRVEVQAVGVADDGNHLSAPTARSVAYRTPMVYLPTHISNQTPDEDTVQTEVAPAAAESTDVAPAAAESTPGMATEELKTSDDDTVQTKVVPATAESTVVAPATAESTPGMAAEELKTSDDDIMQTEAASGPAAVQDAGKTRGPWRLAVSILQAHGLNHLDSYAGDQPCVTCEVKRLNSSAEETRVQTKPVTEGDTLNPFWGETLQLEPWHQGEPLQFTVYDQGLTSSKPKGKVVLTPEVFFPNAFSGTLMVSGLPDALLDVIIRPLDPAASTNEESNKLTVGKEKKRCC